MKLRHSALTVLLFVLFGCASQGDRTRTALDAGDAQSALKALNDELGVKNQEDLPAVVGGDKTVLLLDRAMILQQLEQYPLSSRDLEASDKKSMGSIYLPIDGAR